MQEFISNLSLKQKVIAGGIILILLIIILTFAYKYFYSEEKNCTNVDENVITNEIEEDNKNDILNFGKNKASVIVHVIGEVNTPGVVTLNEGARIIDAINACGGKTDNADLSKVNLAFIVEDATQIYIPRINDNLEQQPLLREDAGNQVIIENVNQESTDSKEIKVNINNANIEKLKTLPGIGDSMAQKIIDYRDKNGKFKTVDDIKNVSGIGESKFNNIKEYITVK